MDDTWLELREVKAQADVQWTEKITRQLRGTDSGKDGGGCMPGVLMPHLRPCYGLHLTPPRHHTSAVVQAPVTEDSLKLIFTTGVLCKIIVHAGSAAIHVTDVAAHVFDRVTEVYEQNVRRKKALKEVTAPPLYVASKHNGVCSSCLMRPCHAQLDPSAGDASAGIVAAGRRS